MDNSRRVKGLRAAPTNTARGIDRAEAIRFANCFHLPHCVKTGGKTNILLRCVADDLLERVMEEYMRRELHDVGSSVLQVSLVALNV